MEGADVLDVFFEGGIVGQGLEVDIGGLDGSDKEGAGVGGKEFVCAGTDDDGEAADCELLGSRVRRDCFGFAGAVRRVGGMDCPLDGVELAADGGGVRGRGDGGRVGGVGEGGGRRRSEHDEVRRATDATGVSGVDG